MVSGSSINAGRDVSITATGKHPDNSNSGDILIGGSQIKVGNNLTLDAQNDIPLAVGANTQQTTGKNSSSGEGVGVRFGGGSNGGGLNIFTNVNAPKGSEKGNGISGRDTTQNGAQVSGGESDCGCW